jgi:hypothetical protein
MTENEVRELLKIIELEKQFPSFTELRKRVIEGLPNLLNRECPEIVAMIPRVPFYSELEQVAHRLINNGNIWGPTTSYVASALTPRFGLSTCEDDLGRLRAKVLEALPVLLGWLKAHEVMTLIPVSPLNAMPPMKLPAFVWKCGTGNFEARCDNP